MSENGGRLPPFSPRNFVDSVSAQLYRAYRRPLELIQSAWTPSSKSKRPRDADRTDAGGRASDSSTPNKRRRRGDIDADGLASLLTEAELDDLDAAAADMDANGSPSGRRRAQSAHASHTSHAHAVFARKVKSVSTPGKQRSDESKSSTPIMTPTSLRASVDTDDTTDADGSDEADTRVVIEDFDAIARVRSQSSSRSRSRSHSRSASCVVKREKRSKSREKVDRELSTSDSDGGSQSPSAAESDEDADSSDGSEMRDDSNSDSDSADSEGGRSSSNSKSFRKKRALFASKRKKKRRSRKKKARKSKKRKRRDGKRSRRVGVVFDKRMALHEAERDHCERPQRILAMWQALKASRFVDLCKRIPARKITTEEVLMVHSDSHWADVRNLPSMQVLGPCADYFAKGDMFWNRHSSLALKLSAGSLIDLTKKVIEGDFESAFAVIRPPGHHAGVNRAEGFCWLNNVAIAARYAQRVMGMKKVAIVDWDVHHGNGTQAIFDNDDSVLYISLHRFGIYPGTGEVKDVGGGTGRVAQADQASPPSSDDEGEGDDRQGEDDGRDEDADGSPPASAANEDAENSMKEPEGEDMEDEDDDQSKRPDTGANQSSSSSSSSGQDPSSKASDPSSSSTSTSSSGPVPQSSSSSSADGHRESSSSSSATPNSLPQRPPAPPGPSSHPYAAGGPNPQAQAPKKAKRRPGEGFSVNIPWSRPGMGPREYKAAFRRVILPILKEFDADILFVSAGFDAAAGDPLGGMAVTSDCYGWMTRELMKVQREARMVMALEGGYNLTSISKAAVACVAALLRVRFPVGSFEEDDQYGSAIPFDKFKQHRDSEDEVREGEERARQRKRRKTAERERLEDAVVIKSEGEEENNAEMKDVDSDAQPHGSTVEVSMPGFGDANPFAHVQDAAQLGRLATRPVLCLSSMFKEDPGMHSDADDEESDANGESDKKEEFARPSGMGGYARPSEFGQVGAMSLTSQKKKRDTLDFGPETILCRVEELHAKYWKSIKPRPRPSPPVPILSANEVDRARFANLVQHFGYMPPAFAYHAVRQDNSAHPPPSPADHTQADAIASPVFGATSPGFSPAGQSPSQSVPQSPGSHANGDFLAPTSPQPGPPPLPSGYGSSSPSVPHAHPPPLPNASKDRSERAPSQPPPLPRERVVPSSGLDLTAVAVGAYSGGAESDAESSTHNHHHAGSHSTPASIGGSVGGVIGGGAPSPTVSLFGDSTSEAKASVSDAYDDTRAASASADVVMSSSSGSSADATSSSHSSDSRAFSFSSTQAPSSASASSANHVTNHISESQNSAAISDDAKADTNGSEGKESLATNNGGGGRGVPPAVSVSLTGNSEDARMRRSRACSRSPLPPSKRADFYMADSPRNAPVAGATSSSARFPPLRFQRSASSYSVGRSESPLPARRPIPRSAAFGTASSTSSRTDADDRLFRRPSMPTSPRGGLARRRQASASPPPPSGRAMPAASSSSASNDSVRQNGTSHEQTSNGRPAAVPHRGAPRGGGRLPLSAQDYGEWSRTATSPAARWLRSAPKTNPNSPQVPKKPAPSGDTPTSNVVSPSASPAQASSSSSMPTQAKAGGDKAENENSSKKASHDDDEDDDEEYEVDGEEDEDESDESPESYFAGLSGI